MNIIEFIKYFAKYPKDIELVTAYFKNSNSDLSEALKTEYDDLKTELTNLSVTGLISELNGFCFGNNIDELITSIKNIEHPFLYVMYPEYNTRADDEFNNVTTMKVIFSVLHEFSERNKDAFERLIIEKHCEDIRLQILDDMIERQMECNTNPRIIWRDIEKVYETSFGCIGWTTIITWEVKGIY